MSSTIYFEDLSVGVLVDIQVRRGAFHEAYRLYRYVPKGDLLNHYEVVNFYHLKSGSHKKISEKIDKLKCLNVGRYVFVKREPDNNTKYLVISHLPTMVENYEVKLHRLNGKPRHLTVKK